MKGKLWEVGGREAEDDCQCQHEGEGKDPWQTDTVVLPSHLQPARDESSMGHTAASPSQLHQSWREVHPALFLVQKQDFKEDFLVLGDEQEGLCRPRNLIRQHIPATLKNIEFSPHQTPHCEGLVASFQILVLFEVEFLTPMRVVSQSIPSEHG